MGRKSSKALKTHESQCHWAAARGQTALPTRWLRAHLRCETQLGASAHFLKAGSCLIVLPPLVPHAAYQNKCAE